METTFVRSNGFMHPYHPLQIISWILTSAHFIIACLIISPLLDYARLIVFCCIFYSTQVLVVYFAYKATNCDPTDQAIYDQRKALKQGKLFDTAGFTAICSICNTCVTSTSKHCGRCNRCVDSFDHHCKWLNNCIGRKNYRDFIYLITSLEINMIILFSFSLYLIVLYYQDHDTFVSNIEESYYSDVARPFIAILYFSVFSSLAVGFAVANLIGLHIWLKMHRLTTYEHICIKRAKKKAAQKLHSRKIKATSDRLGTCNMSENIGVMSGDPFYNKLPDTNQSKLLNYNHDNIFSKEPPAYYSMQPEINDTALHSGDLGRYKTERVMTNLEATDEGLTRSPVLKELHDSFDHDVTFDGKCETHN